MSCNNINYLEYYPRDNKSIDVDIRYQDGTKIDNLQQNLVNSIFQAQDSSGTPVLTLQMTDDPARIIYRSHQGEDRLNIQPLITDMNIDPGEYNIYLKLILRNPDRNHHVQMFKDGVQLTKLKILAGGIA